MTIETVNTPILPSDIQIQVHQAGTMVVIDRLRNWIGVKYPKDKEVRHFVDLDTPLFTKYTKCRKCDKTVSDENLAFAYWKHEQGICSSECLRAEQLARFACCEKAVQRGCVCLYSTDCPDHGQRCNGTHD